MDVSIKDAQGKEEVSEANATYDPSSADVPVDDEETREDEVEQKAVPEAVKHLLGR